MRAALLGVGLLMAACAGADGAAAPMADPGTDEAAAFDAGVVVDAGSPTEVLPASDSGAADLQGGGSVDGSGPDAPASDIPTPPAEVPPCDGSVLGALEAITPVARDTDGWSALAEAAWLGEAMWAAGTGSAAAGAEMAWHAGYTVCRGTGAEADLTLWRPEHDGEGRAWAVLRDAPTRGVILSVPHPWFELYVRDEGVTLLEGLGARALILSGTHRCANAAASPCDGISSACGSPAGPYRESDMAHTVDSTFHWLHVGLEQAFPDDVFVSVHGMSGDGASVSDGTKGVTGGAGAAAAVAAALAATFPGELVTACNPDAGVPHDERLCGTTNVQGRLVNDAGAVCTTGASSASGRFVHLEQSKALRQQPAAVLQALSAALPPLAQ